MVEKTLYLPIRATIKNISKFPVSFIPYRESFVKKLEAGETLKIQLKSSEEAKYYLKQATNSLTVITEDVPAVEVISSKAVLDDGSEVEIIDNALTLNQGDVLDYVEALVTKPVSLEGTPKSYIIIDETQHIHGLVTVDETDPKIVYVTPSGSNGICATVGTFQLKVLEDSVKTANDEGNAEVIITLTVVAV